MSVSILLFCNKITGVKPKDIEEFLEEGSYWEPGPKFERNLSQSGFFDLKVRYKPKKKPFVVSFYPSDHEVFTETKREILEVLREEPTNVSGKKVMDRILKSVQMFVVEVDPVSIAEEDWKVVDSLEAHLAKISDALIYSSGEFFEVKNLIRNVYSFQNGSY
ncbi:hypothetical protein DLM76_12735 [Leptospira yasudae]|uniref:hypothetical protein n=1 Tax=Leptospira yasudae TaxID=2202201 RepID=UPI000E59D268|nr:hypothetical protein [Leptospira yasudae]RHX93854.1 hypothetical protein DLM76_12735 [Leptospira yasudae]TGK25671.1 hypothetical protein EHQ05_12310 [Leptospira yasudae]TGM02770.1 hypothetical protein EHQ86_17025 [Leptospira yasudae]